IYIFFYFNDSATTENYTLSLHDALPILDKNLKYLPKLPSEIKDIAREWDMNVKKTDRFLEDKNSITLKYEDLITKPEPTLEDIRSEEHTSELQSRENLVCRLLLEKKKNK